MTDIIDGLTALINKSEGRLYDHEREFLKTAIVHIQGIRAVAGKSSAGPSFREMSEGIPRRSDEPTKIQWSATQDFTSWNSATLGGEGQPTDSSAEIKRGEPVAQLNTGYINQGAGHRPDAGSGVSVSYPSQGSGEGRANQATDFPPISIKPGDTAQ